MYSKAIFCRSAALALVLASAALGHQAAWAEEEETSAGQERIDRLKAEADLERARADRDKAGAERIAAFGLPSFEGKTTLNEGAGQIEANMLAMQALRVAARSIKERLKDEVCAGRAPAAAAAAAKPCFLVLAGNEPADFSQVGMIEAEISAIGKLYNRAGEAGPQSAVVRSINNQVNYAQSIGLGTAVAAASAIAGLIRSETTISAVDLPAVSERALANEVAGLLGERAAIPSAAVGPVDPAWPMLVSYDALQHRRDVAATSLAREKAKPAKKQDAEWIEQIEAVNSRFDRFAAKVSERDDSGVVPIIRAARLESLLEGNPYILRVHVDKAGGSLVHRTNIGTFLGVDPLRVTGGLIASYNVTDPNSGRVAYTDILVCRTSLSRLRPIHDASWKGKKLSAPDCSSPYEGSASEIAGRDRGGTKTGATGANGGATDH